MAEGVVDRGIGRAAGRSRQWGRTALWLASAALLVGLGVSGAGFCSWLVSPPPPPPCPLPALSVPRPGDILAWSPDGRRLLNANRSGEVCVVGFPGHGVSALPAAKQTPWGAAWDHLGRPLLVFRVGFPWDSLRRLDSKSGKWLQPTTISAGMFITASPGGRYAAMLQQEYWIQQPRMPPPVAVFDLATDRQIATYRLRPRTGPVFIWKDGRTLAFPAEGGDAELRCDTRRRTRSGSPLRQPPQVTVTFQPEKLPGAAIRRKLREWRLLPAGGGELLDWSLVVRDGRGRELRRVFLGRRGEQQTRAWYHSWKAAAVSPDQRTVVVHAPDDTLRYLDLAGR